MIRVNKEKTDVSTDKLNFFKCGFYTDFFLIFDENSVASEKLTQNVQKYLLILQDKFFKKKKSGAVKIKNKGTIKKFANKTAEMIVTFFVQKHNFLLL